MGRALVEGMLPTTWDGTSAKLDGLIAAKTSQTYRTYAAWRTAYAAACTVASDSTTNDPALDAYQKALAAA